MEAVKITVFLSLRTSTLSVLCQYIFKKTISQNVSFGNYSYKIGQRYYDYSSYIYNVDRCVCMRRQLSANAIHVKHHPLYDKHTVRSMALVASNYEVSTHILNKYKLSSSYIIVFLIIQLTFRLDYIQLVFIVIVIEIQPSILK